MIKDGRGKGMMKGKEKEKEKEMTMPASLLELIPEKYRYAATIGNNPEDIKK